MTSAASSKHTPTARLPRLRLRQIAMLTVGAIFIACKTYAALNTLFFS